MSREVIRQGAEAELVRNEYLGNRVVVKDRVGKNYRNAELDLKIRSARTRQECNILHKIKELGVRSPVIYKIDRKETRIVMEYIEGGRMKDYLAQGRKDAEKIKVCEGFGKAVAKMHKAGVVHGDLTTSNVIVMSACRREKGAEELVFLDFGLGYHTEKQEDKAVDLLGFRKTYEATHFAFPEGWEAVLKAYLKEWKQGKTVVEHMKKVEKRVRYH